MSFVSYVSITIVLAIAFPYLLNWTTNQFVSILEDKQ